MEEGDGARLEGKGDVWVACGSLCSLLFVQLAAFLENKDEVMAVTAAATVVVGWPLTFTHGFLIPFYWGRKVHSRSVDGSALSG